MTYYTPDLVAHRVASEFVRREKKGVQPLGRDSLYNAVREAAIAVLDELLDEVRQERACDCRPYHALDCPAFGEGADRRTHLRSSQLGRAQ